MWKNLEKKKQLLQNQKITSIKIIFKDLVENKDIQVLNKELTAKSVNKSLLSYFLIISKNAHKKMQVVRENVKKGVFLALTDTKALQDKMSENELVSIALVMMFKKGNWDYNAQKIINNELRKEEDNQKQILLIGLFGARSKEDQEKVKKIVKHQEKAEQEQTQKTTQTTPEGEVIQTAPETSVSEYESGIQQAKVEYHDDGAVFWVASKHQDSASDHKAYQGKIYYDANYDKRDTRITRYILKHQLMSVQEVTSRPVWFITRPHCRHYFVHYTYDQIVHRRYHIPTRKIGMRRLATTKIAGEGIHEERVRTALEYYTNRLNDYLFMARIQNNYIIRAEIQKTRDLIKKWKQEI